MGRNTEIFAFQVKVALLLLTKDRPTPAISLALVLSCRPGDTPTDTT